MSNNMGGGGGSSGGAIKKIPFENLPALVGSEKQIAWANEIRQGYVNKINDLLNSDGNEDIESEWDRLTYSNLTNAARSSLYSKLRKEGMGNKGVDEYVEKIFNKANQIEESAIEKARKKGIKRKEANVIGTKARSNYMKKYLYEAVKYALSQETSASGWIDARKRL